MPFNWGNTVPRNNLTYTNRTVKLYLTTDKPLSRDVICSLIKTLVEYYGVGSRIVIAQLKLQLDKAGVQAEIPSQSTYSNDPKTLKTKVQSTPKVSNLKLEIRDCEVNQIFKDYEVIRVDDDYKFNGSYEVHNIHEVEKVEKVESTAFKKIFILNFKVKDKVLPPWYMRADNKKAIIKLESILNNNPNQVDGYVKKMVGVIKACSPEEELEKINYSVEWYKKNINRFTKQPKVNDTNRLPFVADLIIFGRDSEEDKITASIFIKFRDYLGYLPFTVDTLDEFLDAPDDRYQLFVKKNGFEYKLSLEITDSKGNSVVKYSVTLAIYENKKSNLFKKNPDFVPKGMCDETYTLTSCKEITSRYIKLCSKNGYEKKQVKKVMSIFDHRLSLSNPGQWLIEATKLEEKETKKINDYQYGNDAESNLRTIQQYSDQRPELSSTVNNTYIIKFV